jgi:phage tail sheath protein FI|tara:strand:+ start:794 stop:2581 length:1788 start_codon:yes stop_codon:yes gene_type:complete
MAETILSPGVLQRENDQSFIAPLPTEVGASIIGPTVKGPVTIPTLVTSYSEFNTIFGTYQMSGSRPYSFLTSIAANNYFSNGGNSLWVTRVVSQSFLPATSSAKADTDGGMNTGSGAPGGVALTNASPFQLETISEGSIMNSGHTEVSGGAGALTNGTIDNLRWEIPTVNTSSGTFSLIIRRGDDDANQKIVLESYNNLSLDPNSPNFISKVIGDMDKSVATDGTDYYIKETGTYPNASAYVRVKAVNNLTPDYFDNAGVAKNEFTASLPDAPQSSSLDGAIGSNIPDLAGFSRQMNFYSDIDNTDSQGLVGDNYTSAVGLMANTDDYKFNVLTTPGLINANALQTSTISTAISNTQARGDSMFIVDLVNYDTALATVTTQAAGFDSSYAAAYWPWLQVIDPNTAEIVWVPASTMIPGVYAFTDASSDPWFAPAGITRGALGQVIRAERRLTVSNRDTLYEANVNPIATFPGQGVVVFGQKTLQKKSSALDRVNVRRLMIALKNFIGQVSDNLVFEQNTIVTRSNFLSQVNPYLESVQQRQGLYAFKVVMDDTNNTPAVIDRNQLVGQIYLQPTKTAEFIILDFNILPTGATFPA